MTNPFGQVNTTPFPVIPSQKHNFIIYKVEFILQFNTQDEFAIAHTLNGMSIELGNLTKTDSQKNYLYNLVKLSTMVATLNVSNEEIKNVMTNGINELIQQYKNTTFIDIQITVHKKL